MVEEDVARLAFLEGLVRIILVGPKALAEFVLLRLLNVRSALTKSRLLQNIAQAAWVPPKHIAPVVLVRLTRQLARAIDRLVTPEPQDDRGGVLFSRLYSSAIYSAVLDLLSTHFRPAVLPTLPPDGQIAIVECYLPLVAGLTVDQYSCRSWPPPAEVEAPSYAIEARQAIQAVSSIGSFAAVSQAAQNMARSRRFGQGGVSSIGLLALGLDDAVSTRLVQVMLPVLFEVCHGNEHALHMHR
jgi:hypothetical protein